MTEQATAVTTPAEQMAVAPTQLYIKKDTAFHFKKDDLGNKRPSVTLQLPFLTLAGVAAIINMKMIQVADDANKEDPAVIAAIKHNKSVENQQELLLSELESTVYVQARSQVNDNVDINQETLDLSKLSWEFIANIPKAERKGAGISKEVWEAFVADYIAIMPALIGRDVEKVTNAATLLSKRFQPVKTVKKVISQLKEYLDIWFSNTASAEDLAEVYEFLSKKAEELLAADEAKLLDNI